MSTSTLRNNETNSFNTTAARLAKNPLGIIALFIVLVYGFASLVTLLSQTLTSLESTLLVCFLIFFPVLVLAVFAWLVGRHSNALYGPGDYRHEDNYIRMQLAAASSLAAATACHSEAEPQDADFTRITDMVRHTASNVGNTLDSWRRRILWVDSHPDQNTHVRKAFEAFGIAITLAHSVVEALAELRKRKFAVIISSVHGQQAVFEAHVLLDALRRQGDQSPFFLYSYHKSPERGNKRSEALQRGAQGHPSDPGELFLLVTNALIQLEGMEK